MCFTAALALLLPLLSYLTEFQSHEPEFDYLKSMEIEEKINAVKWVDPGHGGRGAKLLLAANDKTIKLWRVRSAGYSSFDFSVWGRISRV